MSLWDAWGESTKRRKEPKPRIVIEGRCNFPDCHSKKYEPMKDGNGETYEYLKLCKKCGRGFISHPRNY